MTAMTPDTSTLIARVSLTNPPKQPQAASRRSNSATVHLAAVVLGLGQLGYSDGKQHPRSTGQHPTHPPGHAIRIHLLVSLVREGA